MTELPEQPGVETACPKCGAHPTNESVAKHKLSSMGYHHDDQTFECSECDNSWCHGVPIGRSEEFVDDLLCENPLCEREWCRIHRADVVRPNGETAIRFHKKCPECYYFGTFRRDSDAGGLVLVGYPDITGDTDGADPYGYK